MRNTLLIIVLIALLASCNGNRFEVDGRIDGASDSTQLVLETSSNGSWFLVDSVAVNGDGTFAVKSEAPAFPNIYRLRIGGDVICFPIDSLDHITVTTSLKGFATDYTLAGSDHAVQVMNIDKEAMKLAGGAGTPEQLAAFKRKVSEQIVTDPAGIVAYYAINKYIGGRPLYDPLNDDDLRIIGAVANAFYSFKPQDPRTDYLVSVLTAGQQRRRAAMGTDTIFANETSLIDIDLQDYDGKRYALSEVAASHRVVLLSFTMYEGDFSPVYNKMLNDIYTKYQSQGLTIYQISLDSDPVAWRQAAQNLPWITVPEPAGPNSVAVGAYQVAGVPSTFIIKGGDIVERVDDPSRLQAALARWM
ncbi:MAG: redoxin domain-containing protein [Muribaculaceae bacterium]|nr:redoxin domain-containing protein [Muribaculaceae bacterium]